MFKLEEFPWEKGEKPFFTNEEGFDWYVDKKLTEYCMKPPDPLQPLNAVCFFVVKNNNLEGRVLIDKKTNKVIGENLSLESMLYKIDFLRLALND